jgi:hypothetical protein
MISDIDQLKKDLLELDQKRSIILKKIQDYQNENKTDTQAQLGRPSRPTAPVATQDKIALFLELFRCRESIYPKFWENKRTNKKGYSPVCSNEWISGVCEKPRIKCADCKFQAFAPLDSSVAEAHLKGLITIGTYAIKEDDKATFLACDFDGQGWREDVMAYKNSATMLGVDSSIAITLGMYRKRAKTYRSMGYFVEEPFLSIKAKSHSISSSELSFF